MVVCKCRKATKLYCFVHKVPVCGECICFPEHQICVVRTYSEWVIDGEYDWPTRCCSCNSALEDGSDFPTTRLGCLHIIHTSCLVSHIQSYPPHTAPAGYVCPSCTSPIWPPKSIKDSGSRLHLKLKEAVVQTGLGKDVFGNHLPAVESRSPPPAFASEPPARIATGNEQDQTNSFEAITDPSSSMAKEAYMGGKTFTSDIVEIDGPTSLGNQISSDREPNYMKSLSPGAPGATTRKGPQHVDRQFSEISYYADDEDGGNKKYTRRGPFHHKFLRRVLPFWSSALPTLPVTAPPRRDSSVGDDIPEGRLRHQRSSRMDPRKILLIMALTACMATMVILYYRLAQRSLLENRAEVEQQ
ncbi:hypothetical protein H6P81_020637 [Aristolochia fimbriata]|uniref:RING-type domain-containing protein n=1 Tax=Aristolochia fimbriata TaxID=158543 RepID=A0AAV7DZD7_ARIFI|nr:hypothetical protein H6P81_020637 [Aristolochia fimbriata]